MNFENGLFVSQPISGPSVVPNTYYDALNVWNHGRRVRSDRGTLSSGASASPRPVMLARGLIAGMTISGSFISWLVDWYAGQGNGVIGAVVIGASGGVLMLAPGGVPVTAGLAQPPAPTVTVSGTVGRLTGSYAFAVCAFRATTGALSSRSPVSVTIVPKAKKAHIVFGAAPSGTTHWVLGGTIKGLGSAGLVRFITDPSSGSTTGFLMVPVATLSVDIDYLDGDLGDDMPLDNDPPPSGITHIAVVGKCMCVFTANGKAYISKVGLPESFPPDFVTSLPVRETMTGCNSDTIDGATIYSTANSVGAMFASNAGDVPVIFRPLMRVGFAQGNAWHIAYDQIRGFTDKRGFVRTQGSSEPDTSFGIPVMKFAEDNGWTSANVFTCHAPNNNGSIFAGPGGGGGRALIYHDKGDSEGRWSGPIELPGVPVGAVMRAGIGLIDVGGTMYELDAGGAGGAFFAKQVHTSFGGQEVVTDSFTAEGQDSCTIDVQNIPDGTSTPATIGGLFPTAFTAPHGSPHNLKPNRRMRDVGLRWSGTGGNKESPAAVLNVIADGPLGRF